MQSLTRQFNIMEFRDFIEDICFVIVLYQRKPAESPAFMAVQKLNDTPKITLFVYDNSAVRADTFSTSINYHHDPQNSGVSKAYNEASRFAKEKNLRWLLLLDQDTEFDMQFIDALFSSINSFPSGTVWVPQLYDQQGIVSPFRWRWGRGWRIKRSLEKMSLRKHRFANSGLLISRETFEKSGGYIESIPLDFSDIAFQEKLMNVVDHFIVVDAKLRHDFSGSSNQSAEESLFRFRLFCLAGYETARLLKNRFILASVLSRAVNLTFRYRRLDFLKEGFRIFYHANNTTPVTHRKK